MTTIILLLILLASVASLRLAFRDGRGPQRPPVSHVDDARFHSPGAVG